MSRKITTSADPAHKETDRIIAGLEKKLKTTYSKAYGDAAEKFMQYMAAFDRKDAAHRADVAAGRWTEQEYTDWRRNQLLYADTLAGIRDTIAKDLHNTDKIAMQMVRDQQVDVYALNHNYATYEVEHGLGIDTSYTLYDHDTVERLMKDDPQLLPKPSARRQREIDAKDIAWNQQKLTSAFTASILSGDSIPKMAQKISEVAEMDRHAAVRNARTMCTGAENAGRSNGYKRAEAMGIDLKQQWVATLDGRTRDSHRELDGEIIKVGAKFSNGCRFPGDPEGAARETYNCRCALVAVVNGIDPMAFDKTDTLRQSLGNSEITYEEWKRQHRRSAHAETSQQPQPINGSDIRQTWNRRADEFELEIEDILNAQGFDGLPKVVDEEEFNKAAEKSNFIGQRGYTAPDEETLQRYQDELYHGHFYVECSTHGAALGQGMYGSYASGTEVSSSMASTSAGYGGGEHGITETFTLDPSAKTISFVDLKAMMEGAPSMDALMEFMSSPGVTPEAMQAFKDKYAGYKNGATGFTFDNCGTYAAALGFDAILDPSSMFVVVLNRTKLIFKKGGAHNG